MYYVTSLLERVSKLIIPGQHTNSDRLVMSFHFDFKSGLDIYLPALMFDFTKHVYLHVVMRTSHIDLQARPAPGILKNKIKIDKVSTLCMGLYSSPEP